MTSPVEIVSRNMDLYEAAIYLKNHNFRRIIVVNDEGKLLGLVTQTDLKKHLGALCFVKFESIENIITKDVITAGFDENLTTLIWRMKEYDISCLVICENNKPLGIVTERDVTHILSSMEDRDKVFGRKFIGYPLITISANISIYEATTLMKKKNIRRLVVVDKNKCLVGLVTESDIVRHLEREYLGSLRSIVNREIKCIDNIKVGIFECTLGIDGIFTWINMMGAQILGYKTDQEVIGKKIKEIFVDNQDLEILYKKLEIKGIAKDFNTILKKSDNKHFYAEGTFYFIPDEDGKILCLEGIFRNITERKKKEDQLNKYSKQLERKVEERTAESLKTYEELQIEIIEHKQAEEKLQRRHQIQSIINTILSDSLKPYSLEKILNNILEQLASIDWLALRLKAAIFLVEDNPNMLIMKTSLRFSNQLKNKCAQIPLGKCFCGQAATTKKMQFTSSTNDNRYENRYECFSSQGHYCIPILFSGAVLGVLNLSVNKDHHRNVDDEEFLGAIANVMAGIIERKRADRELKKREMDLEIKNKSLEETNTALRVLLKRREEDKIELEEKMLSNVKELVSPYLEKLKKKNWGARDDAYLRILESNLNDITSSFSVKLSSKYLNFTPTEIKVANLIKHGNTTKEVAELLGLSIKTIETHRENIRKKLRIVNKKTNLRTHLLNLQ
jgi:PAS domain S-box-containing protein